MAGTYPNLDASDLEFRTRLYLDEAVADFYSQAELWRWFSVASKEIAQRATCIRRILDAQTTSGVYSVSTNTYKVSHVEYIPSTGRPVVIEKIDPLKSGHNKLNGASPQFWYELGSLIGIDPVPDATYKLRLYVIDIPKMVDLSISSFSSGWTAGTGWSASTTASHTGATAGTLTYGTVLSASTNYTIEFTVTGIGTGGTVTPYAGSTAGVPVTSNGYHAQNIVSSSGSPALIFNAANSVTLTAVKTYKEANFSSVSDQIEMEPAWHSLLTLYATFSGLVKDKKFQQAQFIESIYRGELAYMKHNMTDIIPDGKMDVR